jgi:tetratricopeptide (TPR) repeat protein
MAAPRALLEIAQQHEKKGNLAKAAKAYSEHLSSSPGDVRVLLRLAEIRERLGEDAVAAEAFHLLGLMHSKDGIEAKAAAAFRRALDLMPSHSASVQPLAELLAKSGKKRDAVNTLETGSRAAAASGNLPAQLKMLERAAQLDEGLSSKLAYAQCLADSGQKTQAIGLLRQAVDQLDAQKAPLERLQIFERLVQVTSGDPKIALEAANAAVALRDHRRALISLRIGLETEPENADLISLVGTVLDVMGEDARALLVFREAARIYGRLGRGDNAKKCWWSVLRLSPDDAEAHAAVGSVPSTRPSAPPPGPLAGIEVSEMDDALSALCEHFPANPNGAANLDPEHQIEISLDEWDTELAIETDPGRDTF